MFVAEDQVAIEAQICVKDVLSMGLEAVHPNSTVSFSGQVIVNWTAVIPVVMDYIHGDVSFNQLPLQSKGWSSSASTNTYGRAAMKNCSGAFTRGIAPTFYTDRNGQIFGKIGDFSVQFPFKFHDPLQMVYPFPINLVCWATVTCTQLSLIKQQKSKTIIKQENLTTNIPNTLDLSISDQPYLPPRRTRSLPNVSPLPEPEQEEFVFV